MSPRFFLLHGFTGSPASWDAVRGALPENFLVDAPEILGHDALGHDALGHDGAGTIDTRSFAEEVDRLARRAVAMAGGTDGAGVHLAGYSQGGRLAVGLLARHPRLFVSATLIGASPGLAGDEARRARRELDEARARQLEEEGLDRFIDAWEALPLFATQRELPAEVRAAQRAQRLAHRAAGLARALRVLGTGMMPDYSPALGGITVPVHLMAGERDAKFRRLAHEMARPLPRASVEIVPGVGHNVALEAPRRVAAALERLAFSESARAREEKASI